MIGGDWLTLPGDDKPGTAIVPHEHRFAADVVGAQLNAKDAVDGEKRGDAEVAPVDPELDHAPPALHERNPIIEAVWRGLTKWQRSFIDALEECKWNNAAARRKLGDDAPGMTTLTRWRRQKDFAFIIQVRKSQAAAELLEKSDIIVHAGAIREAALEPKPVLYQGAPTGYTENQPEVALRANEQLAKLGGHLKQEDGGQMGQGPALIIQVVQRDGAVVDVTPRGVTIDLPGPGGS